MQIKIMIFPGIRSMVEMVKLFPTCLITFIALSALSAQSTTPSHEIYDQLLKKNVHSNGTVDYNGFLKDTVVLNQYLELLSDHPPEDKTWTKPEQMAYWINAYNAFTIKLITKYYPQEL